jgi:putative DNA primase/helicase
MICLVRGILDNEPQAILETAFATGGTAAKRLTRGPMAGGAIKLDADEAVTQGLCIGVELEPCLAARQMGFAPIWALDSALALKRFPVIAGIEGLTIFVDDGEENQAATQVCFDRWLAARRDVVVRKIPAIRGVA